MSKKDYKAGSNWLSDPKNKPILDGLCGQWVAAGKTGLLAHSVDIEEVDKAVQKTVDNGTEVMDDITYLKVSDSPAPKITRQ